LKITIDLPDDLAEAIITIAKLMPELVKKEETLKVTEFKATDEKAAKDDDVPWVEDEPAVKLEEVRAKLAELTRNGKREKVKALLQEYGASKLTEVPKDKLGELMKKAEAIA